MSDIFVVDAWLCIGWNELCERGHTLLSVQRGRACACACVCLYGYECYFAIIIGLKLVAFSFCVFNWIGGTAHAIGCAVVYEPVHPTLCSQSGSCREVCQRPRSSCEICLALLDRGQVDHLSLVVPLVVFRVLLSAFACVTCCRLCCRSIVDDVQRTDACCICFLVCVLLLCHSMMCGRDDLVCWVKFVFV